MFFRFAAPQTFRGTPSWSPQANGTCLIKGRRVREQDHTKRVFVSKLHYRRNPESIYLVRWGKEGAERFLKPADLSASRSSVSTPSKRVSFLLSWSAFACSCSRIRNSRARPHSSSTNLPRTSRAVTLFSSSRAAASLSRWMDGGLNPESNG